VLSEIQTCGNLDVFKPRKIHSQKALCTASGSILHFVLSVRSEPVSTVSDSGFQILESNRCPIEPVTVTDKNQGKPYDNRLLFPKTSINLKIQEV